MVNWSKISDHENIVISHIANRYREEGIIDRSKLDLIMDISAAHITCPLRLTELLNADDFNFHHDLDGIIANIDRKTGKLGHGFRPRFAKKRGK